MAADKLHGDDTPVPVLSPGKGRTKTGRLWAYVRDDRPSGGPDPPAVIYRYSPDRKGERPQAHLRTFTGILQADAYSGFAPCTPAAASKRRPVGRTRAENTTTCTPRITLPSPPRRSPGSGTCTQSSGRSGVSHRRSGLRCAKNAQPPCWPKCTRG